MKTFNEILREAIADIEANGYDSPERIAKWNDLLGRAAGHGGAITEEQLKRSLAAIFRRDVTNGGLARKFKIERWKIDRIAPKLRAELDRKILASAELIKLNREEMTAKTLRRFSGWATSIPDGGSDAVDKRETGDDLKKALKSLPYEERRVIIDQSAKLKSSLDRIVAAENGAIAAQWKSYHGSGYNHRPDHSVRDGEIFAIRDNWAMEKGLMKLGGHKYTDEIEQPAEFVYCSCRYLYIFSLRDLPEEMITYKGEE
jgi:hypothetical protein